MAATSTQTGAQTPATHHPGGPVKHGVAKQGLRIALLCLYFVASALCIHVTQFLGLPLYFYHQDWYYAWQALAKQHFGLLIITMAQWWSPTVLRVSGDRSVRGQLRQTKDGRLETDFPERMIFIANHQLYTEWLYFWWIAYTSRMHGHLYIILKESLKYIPLLGSGMMFFSFVFLSRRWTKDKPRFQHRLQKLNSRHTGPMSGKLHYDPMWLLIFPEGTNLSGNTRKNSAEWAKKTGKPDLRHTLLPRSTGLLFSLKEVKSTVDWVYDCTVAYEGVPRGGYGSDLFTIRSTYFQGRQPKSVNMHFRRFAVNSIPIDDAEKFEIWLNERWREKDDLMEHFMQYGRFPADDGTDESVVVANGSFKAPTELKEGAAATTGGYVETEVRPKYWFEVLQVFVPFMALLLLLDVARKMWRIVTGVFGS